MHRRLVVLTTAAAMVAGAGSLLAGAHAAGLPADYPAAGCFTYTDPTDDAVSPVVGVLGDSDLDITGFALETTATSLKAYTRVPQITNDPMSIEPFDGHRFSLKFTFNKHVFSASGSDYASGSGDSGSGAIRDGLSNTGMVAGVTQLGVDTPAVVPSGPDPGYFNKGFVESGLKVTFDYTNGWVVFDLPLADIQKYGQSPFTGTVTEVSVAAQTDEYAVGEVWDTAPNNDSSGVATGKWTVGDNKCFGPPPAVVTNLGATKVQYGDTAALSAKVVDASGSPVAEAPVTFTIGKLLTTATTNSNGVASAKLTPTGVAGAYTLVESYAGSDKVGKSSVSTPFSIVAEKSVLTLTSRSSGTKRVVTAALRDDDRHAIGRQVILWYVNGKAAGRSTASSAGTATFSAKPHTTVKAVFAGVPGKYVGATTSRKV